MNTLDEQKLDNPVWFSLCEKHRNFDVSYDNVKFYHADYAPFGGCKMAFGISAGIDKYSESCGDFFLVGERPQLSKKLTLAGELICLQMTIPQPLKADFGESILPLRAEHGALLYELVNLVQPGYFKQKTMLLGDYFGIFKDGKLVATAGERMQMDEFVEVSAIITHPDHARRGYAKQLITHTVNKIFGKGKWPFLHVAETNRGAIRLYESLGFVTRRKISFWNIKK